MEPIVSATGVRKMGFVLQYYNLIPVLTAVENVELPLLVVTHDITVGQATDRIIRMADGAVADHGVLAIVFVAVFAAALLTTLGPAARVSRVSPAEALRYE